MVKSKQMLAEIDDILRHVRKKSALTEYCDGVRKPIDECKNCVFFKVCPVGMVFPREGFLLKLRSRIVENIQTERI